MGVMVLCATRWLDCVELLVLLWRFVARCFSEEIRVAERTSRQDLASPNEGHIPG